MSLSNLLNIGQSLLNSIKPKGVLESLPFKPVKPVKRLIPATLSMPKSTDLPYNTGVRKKFGTVIGNTQLAAEKTKSTFLDMVAPLLKQNSISIAKSTPFVSDRSLSERVVETVKKGTFASTPFLVMAEELQRGINMKPLSKTFQETFKTEPASEITSFDRSRISQIPTTLSMPKNISFLDTVKKAYKLGGKEFDARSRGESLLATDSQEAVEALDMLPFSPIDALAFGVKPLVKGIKQVKTGLEDYAKLAKDNISNVRLGITPFNTPKGIGGAEQAVKDGLTEDEFVKGQGTQNKDTVTLYRGIGQKFDENFDLSKTDAPTGYSTYTDNPDLARQYAGKDGFVYKIDLPKKQQGIDLVDKDGERVLFLDNEKKAGLNNVSGKEFLVYNDHELYSSNLISEYKTASQLRAEYQTAKGLSNTEKTQKRLLEATTIPVSDIKKLDKQTTQLKVDEALEAKQIAEQTIDEMYTKAKGLSKYTNKKNRDLPEVTGIGPGQFSKSGDQIVDELGFQDSDSARQYYQDYLDMKETLDNAKDVLREAKVNKTIVARGEELMLKARGDRRASYNAIKNLYDLSYNDLKPILKGQDIYTMPKADFAQALNEMDIKGKGLELFRQAKNETISLVKDKDIKSLNNLLTQLDLPKQSKLSKEQWEQVSNSLMDIQNGDRFLSLAERRFTQTLDDNLFTEKQTVEYLTKNGLKFKDGELDLQDLSKFALSNMDPFRAMEKVLGKELADKVYLNDLRKAQSGFVNMVKIADDKLNYLTKTLKIKQGSKKSGDVMRYGEKLINKEALLKKYTPKEVAEIIEADTFFRSFYDMAIDKVNEVIATIYPNSPGKLVPKLSNYYRHFENKDGIKGFLKILFGDERIAGSLAGISENTRPLTKWQSFKQKRTGDKTEYDAIGGFMDAVPQIAHAISVDPIIPKLRGLRKVLGDLTEDSGKVNNFLQFLEDQANTLAGKTNPIGDRVIEQRIGRTPLRVLSILTNVTKRNQILGNLGSATAQFANVPLALAEYSTKPKIIANAFLRTIGKQEASPFKSLRKTDHYFSKYKSGFRPVVIRAAASILNVSDELTTNFIFNLKYTELSGSNKSIKEIKQLSDDFTRKIQGGRGVGEKSTAQSSQTIGTLVPYTLEITNQMYQILEKVGDKSMKLREKLIYLVGLSVFLHTYNSVTEPVVGRRIAPDPLEAIKDSVMLAYYAEGTDKVTKTLGRLSGEVLSNAPYGSQIAEWVGDERTRKELFGEADPSRFGTDPIVKKAIYEPLTYLTLPAGGGQLKKMIGGTKAWLDGGVESSSGSELYETEGGVWSLLHNVGFGKYSTKNAREYFDREFRADLLPARELIKDQNDKSEEGRQAAKQLLNGIVSEDTLTPEAIKALKSVFNESVAPKLDAEQKLIKQMNAETQARYFNDKITQDPVKGLQLLLDNMDKNNLKKEAMPYLTETLQSITSN